jgi:putative hemolysin
LKAKDYMLTLLNPTHLLVSSSPLYEVRLATSPTEVQAAQKLRYRVFNLELNEGLTESCITGLDQDRFDPVCQHLIVQHVATDGIVGTYRLQTGPSAKANLGYYSEQEFDLRPFEGLRNQIIELGRACVDHRHRNLAVLGLLWRGIGEFARSAGARYLCGCSSVTSQDPRVGASIYADLCRRHLASPEFRTGAKPAYECPLDELAEEPAKVPKLLRAYLSLGAKICGPPALDRQFKTIDFLTLLDLEAVPAGARERFLC